MPRTEKDVSMFKPTITRSAALIVILSASLIPGVATFAQDNQRADRFMQEFDQNQDGNVPRDEYPGSDDAFARLDADQDGAITAAEVQNSLKRKGKSGGNFIARFDADKDGKVSKDEFPRSDELFARLDTNDDGYIAEDEAPASRKRGGRGPGGAGGRP